MMKKPKNLEFEPLHPKNVLLASVVHGISRLFTKTEYTVCLNIVQSMIYIFLGEIEDSKF
jgi:hypothetical protein